MPITLTEVAAREVKRVLEKESHQDWGVRLGVKGGGCSGLTYTMGLEEAPQPHDQIFEIEGVKVFCDPKSYLFINGMTLDYSTDLMGGGFRFNNPNATKTCGCGTSFSA